MVVTSEALFAFVKEAVTTDVRLDAEGSVLFATNPPLAGEPLAKALEAVASLACHERGLEFARHQFDVQTGPMTMGPPARAN